MFVAHGYDAWCSPSAKLGLGYHLTREIAASALPAFLLLAGIGIALRWQRTGEQARPDVRRAIALRGLRLIALGYALNAAYALLDGGLSDPATVLRADVLHAIGASMVLVAVLALGRPLALAVGLALVIVVACPWLSRLAAGATGPFAYALAPFVHVDGISQFSVIPLAALCLAGLMVARADAGPAPPTFAALGVIGLGLALAGSSATAGLLHAFPGPLAPGHIAVLPNAVDGLGRALIVLALGGLVPAGARDALALLGRHSLALYALHIPFCYGRLGAPLRGQLDLAQASLAFALLAASAVAFLKLAQKRPAGTAVQSD